jgi:NUMOD4 motif/HNH endonuclease
VNESVTPSDEPERWLPIADYEGLYEVSDLGRVRSLPRRHAGGRVLKPCYSGPVAKVNLSRDGRNWTFSIHVLVARAFLGPCPDGHEVCHGPAGRRDNRLVNLSYGTRLKNNSEDKRRDGTLPAGVRNGRARLTDEIVRECRRRAAAGESCRALALEFGVEDTAMLKAVAGTAWRHVAEPQLPSPDPEPPLRRRQGRPRVRPIPGHTDGMSQEVIEGSGVAGARRELKQMVSGRWDAPLLHAARAYAESRGLTISDVVRLAVTDYLEENSDDPPMLGWPQLSA